MAETARFQPFDVQLEQALLGALLVDNDLIADAAEHLKPSEFYDPLHREIAGLLYEADEAKKPATPLTLNAWLKHFPGIESVGGSLGYLMRLAQAAPAKPHIHAFAIVLRELRERRDAQAALDDAMGALEARAPIMEALDPVVQITDTIAAAQTAARAETDAGTLAASALRDIEEQAIRGEEFGIRTQLEPLDRIIGGLYPGQAIYVGGRPGMGKSILGGEFCLAAARQGFGADWWSIEMPARECTARLLCSIDYDMAMRERLRRLHYEDLVKRRATAEQMHRAGQAAMQLRELDIAIFDRDRVTIEDIAAVSRARKARDPGKMRLTVIDHLHILTPADRYAGRRVDELSQITAAAKRLAKRLEAPVVVLAQLSRDIEKRDDKRPFMADFRDSGSIEQDADVILTVYRHEYYAERAIRTAKDSRQREEAQAEYDAGRRKLEIGVLKQRSGPTEVVANCYVDAASSAIRSCDPRSIARQVQDDIQGLLIN